MSLPAVLILDDSLTVRMDLRDAFAAAGFDATACGSWQEARDALARHVPALIVLDVCLPDADGLALLQFLKDDPPTAQVPVMLLSSESEVRDRLRGLSLGAEEYVGKPYDRRDLLERARALIGQIAPARTTPLVLLVDDSLTYREALAARLTAAGYELLLASDGEEALRLLSRHRPDALITDGVLPGLTGEALIQHVRLDSVLQRIPCLYLTASEREFDEPQALGAGADAYMRKGLNPALVLARLASLLRAFRPGGGTAEGPRGPQRILVLTEAVGGDSILGHFEGYEQVYTDRLDEALAFLAVQTASCVVIDRGSLAERLAACRQVRRQFASAQLPVVIVVAGAEAEAALAALEAGADECLERTLPAIAHERLRAILRRQRREEQERRLRDERLRNALAAAEAQATLELAEARAALLSDLERQHAELAIARQRAEEATRAKSEFLANMSHEIRTPLMALCGVPDLFETTSLTPVQRHYVEILRRASANLLALVNDVLDLSKIEAGQLVLEAIPFDLAEQIERAAEVAALHAHAKGLELTVMVDPTLPAQVIGDPTRLRQVLGNLLGNAVKFTAAGEIVVRAMPREAGEILLSVSDTGIGIPLAQQAQIFSPFTQADSSTSRRFGGSGLGLSIARDLAVRMGGKLWVESEPGRGSTFNLALDLPVAPVENAAPARAVPDLAGRRVLVVDAGYANRELLSQVLGAAGADVVTADAAAPAHRWLFSDDAPAFDVIFLSARVPALETPTLIERLSPRQRAGLVLTVPSDLQGSLYPLAQQWSLAGCLSKPLKTAELESLVTRLFAPGRPSSVALAPAPPVDAPAERSLRILLAEDSEDNQTIFEVFLAQTPHRLELVGDGAEAVARFESGAYDLVLLDLQMPLKDGYTATREMRAWEAAHGHAPTPILALTAFALNEELQRTREAGCTGFLTKPIKKQVLLEAIRTHARPNPRQA